MTGLIVFLSILLVLFLLLMLKGSFIIEYEKEFALTLKVLCFKIPLVPAKEKKVKLKNYSRKALIKKKEKDKKAREKKLNKAVSKLREKHEKQKKAATGGGEGQKKKMTFDEITELVSVIYKAVSQLFSRLFGYIRTEVVRLHISVCAGSVDKTATAYGACMGGINLLFELLDKKSSLKIKSKDSVEILPDYVGDKFKASIKIIISVRVWQLFGMIIPPAITALKYFIKRLMKNEDKNKKGGQVTPSKKATPSA